MSLAIKSFFYGIIIVHLSNGVPIEKTGRDGAQWTTEPWGMGSWLRNNGSGITFVYSTQFSSDESKEILAAAENIGSLSCIAINVFSENEASQMNYDVNPLLKNYVRITRTSAYGDCFAKIGMQGGEQVMRLNPLRPECLKRGLIMHEMMHSLGYDHEHNRPDRDNYVSIQWKNIRHGFADNFVVKSESLAAGDYDYNSIMHYSAYTFTVDANLPTIVSKQLGHHVPDEQPLELSEGDKWKIQYITGCYQSKT